MTTPDPGTSSTVTTTRRASGPRRVVVLGATGSIGKNTLAVIDHLNAASPGGAAFEVVGLAAGSGGAALAEAARPFPDARLALADPDAAGVAYRGPAAAERLVREAGPDLVVAAIVGVAGLRPVLAAVEAGVDVALANKEVLVAAGELVVRRCSETGSRLLPVDSEHAAVLQCLAGHPRERVRRVVLTASGGPFRDRTAEDVFNATPEEAVAHPNWDMGAKISVDSATMMNKALELIEARHLFKLQPEQLGAVLHPQSVVHALVEYEDGGVVAQLGAADMRGPIQAALTWPDRPAGCGDRLDLLSLGTLGFRRADPARFPALGLAQRVMAAGGTAGAVLNAANEAAVEAFLGRRIPFGRIVGLASEALDRLDPGPADSLDAVLASDAAARRFVAEAVRSSAP